MLSLAADMIGSSEIAVRSCGSRLLSFTFAVLPDPFVRQEVINVLLTHVGSGVVQ